MNVLFLSIGRLNNIDDQGIYTDLLREFRDNGHQVYVVTSTKKRYNRPTECVNEKGVQFLRVKIGNITKTNKIEKGLATIMIERTFLLGIKRYFKDVQFDLVIYSTPPITFARVIRYIKNRDGAVSYLLLKDIFPQNAVDLGMFKKTSPIYWYFRNKEKKLYGVSDYIGCMSEANVNFILGNNPGVSADIVEECPNSIKPLEPLRVNREICSVRKKYGIPLNKSVFIYGGNLGKPQGINFLLDCLESNECNDNVYFVIAGSGTEFNKVSSYFKENKPQNAQLLQQLPKNEYETLVTSCDVGLIFLDNRFTIPNFPSRLLSYMQASMPVLAATDPNTDIGAVIEKGNFGYWCESGSLVEFNQCLEKLCDKDLREKMGKNARKYLENHYTVKHSYEVIMSHFK